MKQNTMEFYDDLNNAIDRAVWLQFQYRNQERYFVVYDGPEDNFVVSDLLTAQEMELDNHFYPLANSYKNLSYERLEAIAKDSDMLEHWENLLGKFSVMEGELLRFIIRFQIPVEKLIRHELVNRGFDQNNQWVGFDASKDIWQNDELKNS
jgi:CRISPR/Cas system CMR-associated protein Cmr3 (group 5 of RAMP superfamily)